MGYIGQQPAKLALTSSDIADGVVGVADLGANSVDTSELVDNAVTLAKMAGGTDGNIISFDASGDPVAIATGSDGQVLTSTGAGSPPAFETAAAGGKIVQYKFDYFNPSGDITINTSNYVDIDAGLTITFGATSASNKLIHRLYCPEQWANNQGLQYILYNVTDSEYVSNRGTDESGAIHARIATPSGAYRFPIALTYVQSSPSTSDKVYRWRVQNAGEGNGYPHYLGGGEGTLIQEIFEVDDA